MWQRLDSYSKCFFFFSFICKYLLNTNGYGIISVNQTNEKKTERKLTLIQFISDIWCVYVFTVRSLTFSKCMFCLATGLYPFVRAYFSLSVSFVCICNWFQLPLISFYFFMRNMQPTAYMATQNMCFCILCDVCTSQFLHGICK